MFPSIVLGLCISLHWRITAAVYLELLPHSAPPQGREQIPGLYPINPDIRCSLKVKSSRTRRFLNAKRTQWWELGREEKQVAEDEMVGWYH